MPDPVSTAAAPERYFNRDLSWLEFNRRVLSQAADPEFPLLERVRFLAIFSSNLDEFVMKRVGLLQHQVETGISAKDPSGLTLREVLVRVRAMIVEMQERQGKILEDEIIPALRAEGVTLMKYQDLSPGERREVDSWFNANVFPILTPLAVDPGHRFPFISNLSESLGVMLEEPRTHEKLFARVKIPDALPRLVPVPIGDDSKLDGNTQVSSDPSRVPVRLIQLENIIANNLDDLFPGMRILTVLPFRITRNAAIEQEDDPEDLLQSVEAELKLRRFAKAVRIETPENPDPAVAELLVSALGLKRDALFARRGPLEYSDLYMIADLPRPELKFRPWTPVTPPRLADGADIFEAIRERDILLHHPYESFQDSVEKFVAAAARDPAVLAIKLTLYRTSRDSPFVDSLIRAAEEGKQVACLVELRARFDESANVRFARRLEKSGVHVAYGVVGLKTHCKTSLVIRRESNRLRSYAHIGTGNYNPKTAQLYTDLGLLTCDPEITDDVVNLFNFLTGRSTMSEYKSLLIAPSRMRSAFYEKIDREIAHAKAGRPARIFAKMNSLEDTGIAEKLYEASAAGVPIELYVRGFCCLRPGVPGLSENISVTSVVGRFLEHSRIYHFANGREDPVEGEWYIASADWMYRNLNNRVEAAAPIRDARAISRLYEVVRVMRRDGARAWNLTPDGDYTKRLPKAGAAPDSPDVLGTFVSLQRMTLGERLVL